MSKDEGGNSSPSNSGAASAPPKPTSASAPPAPSSKKWRLPDGIEDHLEAGLIKTAVGVTVGGLAGLVLFKSGGGWRSACWAAGAGVALGSTYERLVAASRTQQQQQ